VNVKITMEKQVILVDEKDHPIGIMSKSEAHASPNLHRAFSIFIFNDNGELLLQQRALNKYHSGSLWTNTCCSHPQPGENTRISASSRLAEEMGIHAELEFLFTFIYKVKFENGVYEYELDHVFKGKYNTQPNVNMNEVLNWKWISVAELKTEIKLNPGHYTEWLKICFPKVCAYLDDPEY